MVGINAHVRQRNMALFPLQATRLPSPKKEESPPPLITLTNHCETLLIAYVPVW